MDMGYAGLGWVMQGQDGSGKDEVGWGESCRGGVGHGVGLNE